MAVRGVGGDASSEIRRRHGIGRQILSVGWLNAIEAVGQSAYKLEVFAWNFWGISKQDFPSTIIMRVAVLLISLCGSARGGFGMDRNTFGSLSSRDVCAVGFTGIPQRLFGSKSYWFLEKNRVTPFFLWILPRMHHTHSCVDSRKIKCQLQIKKSLQIATTDRSLLISPSVISN